MSTTPGENEPDRPADEEPTEEEIGAESEEASAEPEPEETPVDLPPPPKKPSRLVTVLIVLGTFALGAIVALSLPDELLFVTTPEAVAEKAGAEGMEEHAGHEGHEMEPREEEESGPKEVWACPMLCVKLEAPGTCPVCGMTLERFVDTGDELHLDERQRRMINLRTARVDYRPLEKRVRATGFIEPVEPKRRIVSAWIGGRIDRLFVDFTGTEVVQGAPLVEIYSPELYSAQQELLLAKKNMEASPSRSSRDFYRSAKEKLRLLGLSDRQLELIENQEKPSTRLIIPAPIGGTVLHKNATEGAYVKVGEPLYTVADLKMLWLFLDIYESDLAWIALGQEVDVRVEAYPGETFTGRISFVEPFMNPKTRTVRVRVDLPNMGGRLLPSMFAQATVKARLTRKGKVKEPSLKDAYICPDHSRYRSDEPATCPECGTPLALHGKLKESEPQAIWVCEQHPDLVFHEPGECPIDEKPLKKEMRHPDAALAVPTNAVLKTGTRALVYVLKHPPVYEKNDKGAWIETQPAIFGGREVELGPRAGEYFPVFKGLAAGERVATNGAMLIDSQMELMGKPSLMNVEATIPPKGGGHAGH